MGKINGFINEQINLAVDNNAKYNNTKYAEKQVYRKKDTYTDSQTDIHIDRQITLTKNQIHKQIGKGRGKGIGKESCKGGRITSKTIIMKR